MLMKLTPGLRAVVSSSQETNLKTADHTGQNWCEHISTASTHYVKKTE